MWEKYGELYFIGSKRRFLEKLSDLCNIIERVVNI